MAEALTPTFGEAFSSGIKSGEQWATSANSLRIRRENLQRQNEQLQMQRAQHQYSVLQKSIMSWHQIASQPPQKRNALIKFQETQDKIMGLDTSGLATLAKDPNFKIEVADPLAKLLAATGKNDPQAIANYFTQYQSVAGDPVAITRIAPLLKQAAANQLLGVNQQFKQTNIDTKKSALDQKDLARHIETAQKGMNSVVNKLDDQIGDAGSARQILDQALSEGTSANASSIAISRMINKGARIPVVEINKMDQGSRDLYNRVLQFGETNIKGTMTQTNHDQAMHVIDAMVAAANSKKSDVQNHYAGQLSQVTGIPLEDAYKKLTNKDMPSPDQGASKTSLSPDQIKIIKDGIEKHKNDYSPDEIKQSIEKNLGRPLNDADLNSVGLKPSAPSKTDQSSQPAQGSQAPQASGAAQSSPQGFSKGDAVNMVMSPDAQETPEPDVPDQPQIQPYPLEENQ